MPDFSLILATSGRTTELHRFFSSLEAAAGDCECLVVDQNPDERLLPILAAWEGRLPIKHLKSPPGLSRARNVGLAAATGEVVAFPTTIAGILLVCWRRCGRSSRPSPDTRC